MKILLISEYFPLSEQLDFSGGMEARAFFVGRELAKRHEVIVITSYVPGSLNQQLMSGMRIIRVGVARNYTRTGILSRLIFTFAVIKQILKLKHLDLIEANGFWSYFPAYIGSLLVRSKRVMIVADTVRDYAQEVSWLSKQMLLFTEKLLFIIKWDQIICISKTVKKKVMKLVKNKVVISVVYCGIDFEYIKKIISIRKKQKIIVIARLVSYKRVTDLIEAFKILIVDFPQIRLDIIGKGEEMVKLQKQAKFFSKQIRFLGQVSRYSEVIKSLKQASVFCLPSVVEGFGIATVEALACQTPVALSDILVNHEVTHNKGVLFFQPRNPTDIANKLKLLLTEKKLYQKLQNETEQIAAIYSWSEIGKNLEGRYARLCTD